MALFLVWLLVQSLQLWRRNAPGREIDLSLARAATIVVALIIAHSFADYPLRTAAIMAILAFACGILIAPPTAVSHATADEKRSARTPAERKMRPAPPPVRSPSNAPDSQHPAERWGRDIEWPEDWR
jgi:hypothetical protein